MKTKKKIVKKKAPLEKVVVANIKEYMVNEVGATFHKKHGSVFSERGTPDVHGTLPGGRAYFLEVKRPGRLATVKPAQRIMLQREALNGAVAGAVTSVAEVVELLAYQRYTVIPPHQRRP